MDTVIIVLGALNVVLYSFLGVMLIKNRLDAKK